MLARSLPQRPVLGMVLKGYPRISETFISNEILKLEHLGFQIHLFSMRKPRESFTHASVKRIQARVDYLPEKMLGNLWRLISANFKLAKRRPQVYRRALVWALNRFKRTRKSATVKHLLQAGYMVERLLPGRPVVQLHAHFAHSPTSVAMFASLLSGIPFSFSAHAKDIFTSDRRQLREKINLARFVVTCTEFNRQHLLDLAGTSDTPIHRVYHGIDLTLFNSSGTVRPAMPPFEVLTIARLTGKKGLPTVLHAVRQLRAHGLALRHTLIGDGDDRELILALVRTLGLEETTRWLGTLPHEKVLDHYRRAHLFVLGCEVATNGDRDGIPNVLVESMALGVPVVATDVSAIPELIEHERTGLLVPPRQPGELGRAMKRLLCDEDLRADITMRARDKVWYEFDNQRLIADLADIYRRYVPVLSAADGSQGTRGSQ